MGTSAGQTYRKQHLVPFGEFIPAKPLLGWVLDILHIPLADLSSGAAAQPPLRLAGQRVAINICFEAVFGEEIIRTLPEAGSEEQTSELQSLMRNSYAVFCLQKKK